MPRRDVTDELHHDVLVDIAKGGERRFGTGGRRFAQQHGADTACPFMTKRALMAISEDAAATAPYWRIVKPNGTMMTYFPGCAAAQTRRLKAEKTQGR